MDLWREVVQCPHAVAVAQQLVGQVRADKPGAAGDQDVFSHNALLPFRGARPLTPVIDGGTSGSVPRRPFAVADDASGRSRSRAHVRGAPEGRAGGPAAARSCKIQAHPAARARGEYPAVRLAAAKRYKLLLG